MHTFVDLYFSPEGVSPLEIAERLKRMAGLSFIVGPHDLVFEWETVGEFRERLAKVHQALQGTGVQYRIESIADDPVYVEPLSWPPPLARDPPEHPGY